ncbi:hypothetical protein, partial [Blautia massiliensis (ex Liu et al. 2021)]|uniref:hypothetical protein n=1 Tax=Blautia massiliensis (ex Liu et al. 2021) TaxID=3062492 RepID=UPI003F8A0DFD
CVFYSVFNVTDEGKGLNLCLKIRFSDRLRGVFLLLHNKKTPKKPVFMGFLGIFLFITICAILGLI